MDAKAPKQAQNRRRKLAGGRRATTIKTRRGWEGYGRAGSHAAGVVAVHASERQEEMFSGTRCRRAGSQEMTNRSGQSVEKQNCAGRQGGRREETARRSGCVMECGRGVSGARRRAKRRCRWRRGRGAQSRQADCRGRLTRRAGDARHRIRPIWHARGPTRATGRGRGAADVSPRAQYLTAPAPRRSNFRPNHLGASPAANRGAPPRAKLLGRAGSAPNIARGTRPNVPAHARRQNRRPRAPPRALDLFFFFLFRVLVFGAALRCRATGRPPAGRRRSRRVWRRHFFPGKLGCSRLPRRWSRGHRAALERVVQRAARLPTPQLSRARGGSTTLRPRVAPPEHVPLAGPRGGYPEGLFIRSRHTGN